MNEILQKIQQRSVQVANGCIEWQGGKTSRGYGEISVGNKRQKLVHRCVMEQLVGRELCRWEFVCHRCDNPLCCNPEHLFIGSPATNSQDMRSKQRSKRGSQLPHCRLTEEDVHAIRALRDAGALQKELAAQFGVSRGHIGQILSGGRRKYVA